MLLNFQLVCVFGFVVFVVFVFVIVFDILQRLFTVYVDRLLKVFLEKKNDCSFYE
jgi:hypothetical protein